MSPHGRSVQNLDVHDTVMFAVRLVLLDRHLNVVRRRPLILHWLLSDGQDVVTRVMHQVLVLMSR